MCASQYPSFQDNLETVLFSRRVQDIIRLKVSQLIRTTCLPDSLQEDLEQEVRMSLIERLPRFDSDRSSLTTFVSRVVDRTLVDQLRQMYAKKRDVRRNGVSLNCSISDEEGRLASWASTISQQREDTFIGRREVDPGLSMDLRDAVEDLSSEQRSLCDRLSYQTISEVSRKTGQSRPALYRQIEDIRKRFEDRGLRGYLNQPRKKGGQPTDSSRM